MKNLLLFILILASNFSWACGYYPYGEDTRISLFHPEIFGYTTYANFYFSTSSFASSGDITPKENDEANLKLWFAYCHRKVDIASIDIAVYQLKESDINEQSQNGMIAYLYRQKDIEALNYLRFAKNCEFFNSWQEDPWERESFQSTPKRTELINKAIVLAKKTKNNELKRRYNFLAIRLAWYNHQYDIVQSLFADEFERSNTKDVLYYWSLYFSSINETNSAKNNFQLAQVFSHAVDKRFVCHQNFNPEYSLDETLTYAKTNTEKANVYLFYGIEKPDRALPFLQHIYALNPSSDGLSFLLLREINKIEDFVFTPYYTLFSPAISNDNEDYESSTLQILHRAEQDRQYAKELLQLVYAVDLKKVDNPFFWQCAKAYLQFITRDFNGCLTLVDQLEKSTKDNAIINQLQIIKALAVTANQQKGVATIPKEIQTTLINNLKNGQFVFAIAKELEYLGNTTDAALLYAKLDNSWNENTPVFWKSLKNMLHTYSDYFMDYFNYVDAVYTPEQTQALIDAIQKNQNKTDAFSTFKYESIKNTIPRLIDLLGTKYVRQNKLKQALTVFAQLDNDYWTMNYSAWGNEENIFDQNPFYRLRYTPEFIAQKERFRLNKYSITQQLIHYLNKAENKNEKDRDYYYFLVANAYYNMGFEGNIAAMRRLNGWSRSELSIIEDEQEFRQTNLAKQYYLLAKQYAQTDKFKALCLRMVLRCERNSLIYSFSDEQQSGDYETSLLNSQYYKELNEKHHLCFDDLMSNCNRFENYFEARR